MAQADHPAAVINNISGRSAAGTRPRRNRCRKTTTGVNRKVRVSANARGIRISRRKYSAAPIPTTIATKKAEERTVLCLDELVIPSRRRDERGLSGSSGAIRFPTRAKDGRRRYLPSK